MSWLLSRKPRTISFEPKADSIELVIDTTLPASSMIDMWVVDGSSIAPSVPRSAAAPAGTPARAVPMLRSGSISAARRAR